MNQWQAKEKCFINSKVIKQPEEVTTDSNEKIRNIHFNNYGIWK